MTCDALLRTRNVAVNTTRVEFAHRKTYVHDLVIRLDMIRRLVPRFALDSI